MMDWDKLRIFHSVAAAGSFTRAATSLNLSQSAISRQIAGLEERLQVALFQRHARGLMLTEQGEILYRAAEEMLSRLSAAENALLEARERPRGPLKVTAPVAFGTHWLAHHVAEFSERYPEIVITLLIDDRELDLMMREADIAVRLFPARAPDLVQRSLATIPHALYASHGYVRKYGEVKKLQDLNRHRLIAYPEDTRLPYAEANWILTAGMPEGERRAAALKINSLPAMKEAVERGAGIALMPEYLMSRSQESVRLLPEAEGPKTEIYFIYPLELRNSKRVNVFRDFLLRKLGQTEQAMQ